MLTPLDIHNREFKKSLRGYDVDDVDEFLDEIIKDFESLYKENLELHEKLERQKENLGKYKEMEDTLQNTMVLAQKMAEESKKNAEKEAELLIREAGHKAEEIVRNAHVETAEMKRRLDMLKVYEKQIAIKIKAFLKAQLDMIENSSSEELPYVLDINKETDNNDGLEHS